MRVLSIQSSVAYGHAGNSAAVFPLQRLGHEVVAVDTVHLSNHRGYPTAPGPWHSPAEVAAVLEGVAERGVLGAVDAVLSGYLGDAEMGAVVLAAVDAVRAANPAALYCCDPVMGDVGRGFFVRPGIPEHFRDHVVPRADVLTPNHFELAFLAGRDLPTYDDPPPLSSVLEAAAEVRARGPGVLLVTSVRHSGLPADRLDTIAVSDEGAWAVTSPVLPITAAGTGDLTSALFLAHLSAGLRDDLRDDLRDGLRDALLRTVGSVHAVLEATVAAGRTELAIVDAQDAIAAPPMDLPLRRLP